MGRCLTTGLSLIGEMCTGLMSNRAVNRKKRKRLRYNQSLRTSRHISPICEKKLCTITWCRKTRDWIVRTRQRASAAPYETTTELSSSTMSTRSRTRPTQRRPRHHSGASIFLRMTGIRMKIFTTRSRLKQSRCEGNIQKNHRAANN